jgi:hypothetical protein
LDRGRVGKKDTGNTGNTAGGSTVDGARGVLISIHVTTVVVFITFVLTTAGVPEVVMADATVYMAALSSVEMTALPARNNPGVKCIHRNTRDTIPR